MESRTPPPRGSDILAQKARSAWQAARQVADTHPESAASRAYYAAHHALRWRLGRDLPRGHGGIVSEDVVTQLDLSMEDVRSLTVLYYVRHKADYGDKSRIQNRESRECVERARALLLHLGFDLG